VKGASKPVMLKQPLRPGGNQIQDAYELRLDGRLPKRVARESRSGQGCR